MVLKMNKKILIGIVISVLLLGVIGLSYSFFSVSVTGEGRQNTVTAGTLELQYIDGNGVSLPRAYPGQSVTKVVSVKNIGTLDTEYDLLYKDLINEIENDELVVSYTCTSYTGYVSSTNKGTVSGTCDSLSNQVVPYSTTMTDSTITSKISIASSITHEYTFTFTFKEMNATQNYNQGKHFSTKINITQPDVINVATYKLSGTLLDNNNDPITNATVEIHSNVKTGITDSKGYFEIEGVEAGNHEFKVKNSSGTYIIEDTIKVIESNESNVNGKEISIKKGEVGISLNIKTNNGKISNIEIYKEYTLYEKILADNQGGQSDENIDFAQISSDTNGNGLYYTSRTDVTEDLDGDGTGDRVYYYRGAVTNNNVRFGGYCWRIVRTNEDGSVRLRYNGTYENGTCPTTGTNVRINDTTYKFYESYTNEKYNEYIWEDGTGESLAKTTIDAWYTSSGLEDYEDKIANVPYCADKSNPTKPTTSSSDPYTSYTFYGAANRLININNSDLPAKSNAQPTYKCERTEDKHTVSGDTWGGNGKLSKPIGLLTADEVAFAGEKYATPNSSFYLYTGAYYWLISPAYWSGGYVDSFRMHYMGTLYHDGSVTTSAGLLPAVSLKAETMVNAQGDGTYTNPYVVES